MKTTLKIKAERLRALRIRAGLSQKQLAGRINCDARTVSRWEQGNIDRLRQDTFGRLRRALDATEQDLCGDGPLQQRPAVVDTPKGQLNLDVGGSSRNALSLVAMRYGVTRQQIVEAAPLMFFILAEQSLRERKKRLDRFWEAADALDEATIRHLRGKWPTDDEALAWEEESIEARDLFATKVREKGGYDEFPDYPDDRNPFAEFLRKALSDVDGQAKFEYWPSVPPGAPPKYRICLDQAVELVGGDEEAASAIVTGDAALHEMPVEVRKGSAADRARWARALGERAREFRKWVEQVDDPLAAFADADDERFERWRKERATEREEGSTHSSNGVAVTPDLAQRRSKNGGTTP